MRRPNDLMRKPSARGAAVLIGTLLAIHWMWRRWLGGPELFADGYAMLDLIVLGITAVFITVVLSWLRLSDDEQSR